MTRDETTVTVAGRPVPAWLLFLGLGILLHGWRFVVGATGKVRMHDAFDSEWPRFVNEARALLEFGPQAWLPNISGGMPANAFHFTQFHPFVVLHAWLPPWMVFDLMLLMLMVLSGYGTYRILAVGLAVRPRIALPVALVAMSFAQMVLPVSLFETLSPFVLSLLHWPSARRGWRLAGAAVATLMTLTIYPILQMPALALAHATVLALLWVRGRPLRREVMTAALFWFAMVVAFLPNVVALLAYLPFNSRDYAAASMGTGALLLSIPWEAFRLLADAGGLGTLGGVLTGALVATRWNRDLTVAGVAVALSVLLCTAFSPPVSGLFHGSFLEKMDLHHLKRGLPFLVALMSALALERVEWSAAGRKRFLAGAVAGVALSYWVPGFLPPTLGWLVLSSAFVALMVCEPAALPTVWRRAAAGLLALGVLTGGWVEVGSLVSSKYRNYTKPRPGLAELIRESRIDPFRVMVTEMHPSHLQVAGLELVDGRSPMFFANFRALVRMLPAAEPPEEARKRFQSYWYELMIDRLLGRTVTAASDLRLPLLAAMNVRYVLSQHPIPGLEAINLGPDGAVQNEFVISRVPGAHSRGHLYGRARVVENEAEAKALLGTLADAELADTVVLTRAAGMPAALPDGAGTCGAVTVAAYQPDVIRFDVQAERDCVMVVANNYHQHWHAAVDGSETAIFPANLAFQGIVVPAGRHQVVFAFRQPGFPWSLAAVPLGAVLAFAAFFQPWRRRPL